LVIAAYGTALSQVPHRILLPVGLRQTRKILKSRPGGFLSSFRSFLLSISSTSFSAEHAQAEQTAQQAAKSKW
jgi:hypothetical protein